MNTDKPTTTASAPETRTSKEHYVYDFEKIERRKKLAMEITGAGREAMLSKLPTIPAEKPTHSPLPWSIDADGDIQDPQGNKVVDTQYTYEADAKLIVASVNQAAQLAEALRFWMTVPAACDQRPAYLLFDEAMRMSQSALTAYESEVQS